MNVTFTEDLVVQALDAGNWEVCLAGSLRTVTAAAVMSGNEVELTLGLAGADCPDDVVSFDPPPFDVESLTTGFPAASFANFPIT